MLVTRCMRSRRLLNIKKSLQTPQNLHKIDSAPSRLPGATAILLNRRLCYKTPIGTHFSRNLSTKSIEHESLDPVKFEKACEETLQSLTEYFEELVDKAAHLKTADVSYSSGVLTVNFGAPYGTYVINRQSPNKQIWLSSPTSGPKRYDFVADGEYWLYKHDGKSLHELLQEEIPKIVNSEVDFTQCLYSRV